MKINFLSQYFDPEPTIRDKEFVKKLALHGNELTVITGYPNYPFGKIYDGFKQKIYSKEIVENFTLIRLPIFPSRSNSFLLRLINILSYSFCLSVYLIFFSKKKDISYVYHPPITTALAALLLKVTRKTPYVLDVLDLWPESLTSTKFIKNKFLIYLTLIAVKLAYKHAQSIVVTSPGMKNAIIQHGINKNKIHLIYNAAQENKSSKFIKKNIGLPKNGLNILYAGNIGPAQKLEIIPEISKELEHQDIIVNFIFVGTEIDKVHLINITNKLKCKNMFFYDYVSMDEIGNYLEQSDVGLVKLNSSDLFKITIPGKTMQYMYFGKPILLLVDGDAADLVNNANCGISCSPENKNSIKEAIINLCSKNNQELKLIGQNGKNFYTEHLSSSVAINKLNQILKSEHI